MVMEIMMMIIVIITTMTNLLINLFKIIFGLKCDWEKKPKWKEIIGNCMICGYY